LSRSPSFRQRFAASLAALALLVTPPALAASSSDAVTALAEQLAASARFLSEQLEGQVASLSAAALGSLLGGSVAWQLATLQARRRAEDVARSKTREALNNLDPEALTSVLGELPSWLAYRDFERAGERPLRGGTCHA
jgi:membrane protein YqaA with SNARE-associated domain